MKLQTTQRIATASAYAVIAAIAAALAWIDWLAGAPWPAASDRVVLGEALPTLVVLDQKLPRLDGPGVLRVRKPVDLAAFQDDARTLGLYWLVINQPPPEPQ